MQLYKAALVSVFGGRSQQPYRAAIVRLCILSVLALTCSFALARMTEHMPPISSTRPTLLVPSALVTVEVVVLCALLAASGITRRMYTDRFARLLLFLPISPLQRWTILMTPSIILAILATLLATWPLAELWLHLGMQPMHIAVAVICGIVCALGLFHGPPPRLAPLRFILAPYVVWVQYKLANTIANTTEYVSIPLLCTFVVIACTLGLAWLLSSRYTCMAISRSVQVQSVRLTFLPVWGWYLKKCIRSPAIRLSWTTALGLIAATIAADRFFALGASTISLTTAVIVAAFASDIRALSRLVAPAEITTLKGSRYFAACHATTAFAGGILIALPLFVYLDGIVAILVGSVWMGVATGLFAGSLLAPSPHDISGQFTAGLLCIGILAVAPSIMGDILGQSTQLILPFSLGILLLLAAFGIEYKRNPYDWRNNYHA